MAASQNDTICALATSVGRSGIGIIRVSGPKAKKVAKKILKTVPKNRQAQLLNFYTLDNLVLDKGIALFFKAPKSFTGEDILELQAHGGPVLLDLINQQILSLGVRPARPGEFSERAFLNQKIDLSQAEAIADLIDASSKQAIISANKSLQGDFAKQIDHLVEKLIELRMLVESALDFPEEDIDFVEDYQIYERLCSIKLQLENIHKMSTMGNILREGMTVVIAGEPNVGKSSLLNAITQKPSAIVTDIPGTTRDVLREYISIDGIPLHIIDTAGIRISDNLVEQEGIKRAKQEISNADCVLLMLDDRKPSKININQKIPQIKIFNKVDLSNGVFGVRGDNEVGISAKTLQGIDELKQKIKKIMGFVDLGQGVILARRRHLVALEASLEEINMALTNLNSSLELLAENLRSSHEKLSEITGKFTNDDLLGKIFQEFCIGK